MFFFFHMALILIRTQQIKKIENKDYWINFALLSLHINKKCCFKTKAGQPQD